MKRHFLDEHKVVTVPEVGWAGKKNGELLGLAQDNFYAFVTTDKGIPYQQNIVRVRLAVILLRAKSNDYADLALLIDEAMTALSSASAGTVVRVPFEEASSDR